MGCGREWKPVLSVSWNTFEDLIEESVPLITDVMEDTKFEDLPYIRSFLTTDALSRRRSYTTYSPHLLALLDARGQKDEPTAWALLSGGIRLIEYEETLAAMEDDELQDALADISHILKKAFVRSGAVLTIAGGNNSERLLSGEIEKAMRNWPEAHIESSFQPLLEESGNTRILIDTQVNYNLEYLKEEETGIEYTESLSAFANLITDRVLMPVFRYQNSVYSVFFQINREEAFILTYRDPNFEKTYEEIFPSLGSLARQVLENITQEELDGYISGVYTDEAMPIGPIGRANLAIAGLLQGRDFFEETRQAMHALKTLTTKDLAVWADLLDRLYDSGLKVTVTSPMNADVLQEMFPVVLTELLKSTS